MDIDINKIREDVRSGGRSSTPTRPRPSQRDSSQQERGFTQKVGGLVIAGFLFGFGGAFAGGLLIGVTGVGDSIGQLVAWLTAIFGMSCGWKGKLRFLPRILEKIVGIIFLILVALTILGAVLSSQK